MIFFIIIYTKVISKLKKLLVHVPVFLLKEKFWIHPPVLNKYLFT